MDNNYHIFVIITTIIIYIFLTSRKRDKNKDNSDFMYLFYVPIILYCGFYFFYSPKSKYIKSDIKSSDISGTNVSHVLHISQPNNFYSEELLSDPYPTSSNSNFSH